MQQNVPNSTKNNEVKKSTKIYQKVKASRSVLGRYWQVSSYNSWNINKGSELNLFFIALGYGRRLAHRIFHKIRHLERAAALFILLQPIVIDVEKPKPMKKLFHQLVLENCRTQFLKWRQTLSGVERITQFTPLTFCEKIVLTNYVLLIWQNLQTLMTLTLTYSKSFSPSSVTRKEEQHVHVLTVHFWHRLFTK